MTLAKTSKLADPKNLFLIDGAGALLSAFLLGVVLTRFQNFIGMPVNTLYFLAALPCFFFLYDLYAYFQPKERQPRLLKGIALANIAYCFVSSIALLYHFPALSFLGLAYFLVETLIVLALGIFEYKTAARLIARGL